MIDSHIHLDDTRFDGRREVLLGQARSVGVTDFVVPATVFDGFARIRALSRRFPGVHVAYGLHPYFIEQHQPEDLLRLGDALRAYDCVAVGECGLDFYLPVLKQHEKRQEEFFLAQIALARRHGLPLIIHARKAVPRVLSCLREVDYFRGVIHSYNASLELTRQVLDQGLLVGFGGAVTRPNAHKLHRVVAYVPENSLLLETDAPDQPPWPHWGELNRPEYLVDVLRAVAHIRNQPTEQLAYQCDENARRLFDLPGPPH